MKLLQQVKNCTICADYLPHEPRPVITVHPEARILIVGQAPGRKVHASGIPWDDASGKNLRKWLNVTPEEFYDATKFGIIPMGFCYPGTGKTGDLPPRPECAPKWHEPLLKMMPKVKLTLLIGMYAQKYYLGKKRKRTLTETVNHWEEYLPNYLPIPHPSPRNGIWMRKNPWFEKDIVPFLKGKVEEALK
jgi:uracil-DNA glycosylase